MKTNIIIIRHGETTGNIENRISGIIDFDLTENGKKQAKDLFEKLKHYKIDNYYSSPLKRAVDTAKIITYGTDKEIEICENLKEINFGKCDGMQWEEIDRLYPNVRPDWKEKYFYPINIPGQEDFKKLQKRIKFTIDGIAEKNLGKTICIVSHGLAIFAFVTLIKGFVSSCKIKTVKQLKNCEYMLAEYENKKYSLLNQ